MSEPAPGVLRKDDILRHVRELADELAARDLTGVLVVVGGSFMAWHGLRDSTADVDSAVRLAAEVKAAVATVAARHGLRPDWLNDSAAGFAPSGLRVEDCEVLLDHPHLRVLAPPPDQVFLMKLLASRAPDHDDMVALWPSCAFRSAQDVVDAYHDAYPHEERDPHLVGYVQRVIDLAGRG